jgi:OOP family OmpA-OmpF porin
MRRLLVPSACSGLAFAALLAAGCAVKRTLLPAIPSSSAPLRLAQIGYGQDARFEQCSEDTCPQRTPKILPFSAAVPAGHASQIPDTRANDNAGHGEAEQPQTTPPDAQPPQANASEQQIDIEFPLASARLNVQAHTDWDWIAFQLIHARQIRIVGYTAATGPAQTDEQLAKARADAVLSQLLALAPGIAPVATVDIEDARAASNDGNPVRNASVQIRYLLRSNAPP